MKDPGQNGQAHFLRQMLLQIPGDAGDGPILPGLRLLHGRELLLEQGDFQAVDAGAELLMGMLISMMTISERGVSICANASIAVAFQLGSLPGIGQEHLADGCLFPSSKPLPVSVT